MAELTGPTPAQRADLDAARELVAAGVPVFLGRPDPGSPTGYALPPGWQRVEPDETVVDAWRPGWALCAVAGCALDVVDGIDLRLERRQHGARRHKGSL